MTRFCPITLDEMNSFLAPQGFVRAKADYEARMGQIVYRKKLSNTHNIFMLVYTSIPVGGTEVRDVGGDSIKVSLLFVPAFSGLARPLTNKQSYVQRTNGWRTSLTKRIQDLTALLDVPHCSKCNGPSVRRESKHGEFVACVVWCTKPTK